MFIFQLVGVVSWGMACGSPIYPGVYTDVALYRNWVEEHLNWCTNISWSFIEIKLNRLNFRVTWLKSTFCGTSNKIIMTFIGKLEIRFELQEMKLQMRNSHEFMGIPFQVSSLVVNTVVWVNQRAIRCKSFYQNESDPIESRTELLIRLNNFHCFKKTSNFLTVAHEEVDHFALFDWMSFVGEVGCFSDNHLQHILE